MVSMILHKDIIIKLITRKLKLNSVNNLEKTEPWSYTSHSSVYFKSYYALFTYYTLYSFEHTDQCFFFFFAQLGKSVHLWTTAALSHSITMTPLLHPPSTQK